MRLSSLVLLAALPLSSCATVGEYFREKGLSRAAFDLGCPEEQLKLSYLTDREDAVVSYQSQVGVTGCGKRVTYLVGPKGQWIANAASTD